MSGYGERRSFITHAGSGGVESESLGLPFKSTPCEDWYGFGDNRCPNRYNETGDLETDIISLKKWVGLYGGHGRTSWKVWASNELERKQAELVSIQKQRAWLQLSDEEQQRQQRLVNIDKIIFTLESELSELEKTLAGFHPTHYIRDSIIADINQLKEKITQKKTRN